MRKLWHQRDMARLLRYWLWRVVVIAFIMGFFLFLKWTHPERDEKAEREVRIALEVTLDFTKALVLEMWDETHKVKK